MRRAVAPLALLLLTSTILAGCVGGPGDGAKAFDAKRIEAQRKPAAVFPGEYKFDGAYSQVLVEGPYGMLPNERVLLKSKIDGVDIEIGFWRPDVPEGVKVPVIVHASPYHRVATSVTRNAGLPLYLNDNFLPHGYAVAALAVRGTGNSGGCMDLMGVKENGDLDQAITWLGEQPWSNGNVAMIGGSYDGSTPWSVAAWGNPHLKTIVPISGVPDLYGLMFRNGSAESRGPIALNALYYTYGFDPTDSVTTAGSPGPNPNARTAQHRAEGLVCPESFRGFVAALYSGATGARDPTGWWNERNRKGLVEQKYEGSVLSIQGMQDWNVDPHMVIPWVDQLNQSGVPTKQLLGQWGHAYPDRPAPNVPKTDPRIRWDWAEMLLHWFDYWLKDLHEVDLGPAVQVMDSANRWRNEERYPPADAVWTTYHLSSGQRLSPEPGTAGSVLLMPNPVGDTLGPNLRSVPGHSADFSLRVAEGPLLVSGLPRLHVTVTPHGPTGHLAAYLYDVDEQGVEKRVGWTQINLHFADGTETMRPITPNQPLLVKMQFEPLEANLAEGHTLRLRVWEYTENDRLPAIPPEPVTLSFGGSAKSTLELPIIERGEESYFQPPKPAK